MNGATDQGGGFSPFSAPRGGQGPESAHSMKQENQPLRFGPGDFDGERRLDGGDKLGGEDRLGGEERALQALLSFDKQPPPTLEAMRRDPHRAQALDRLESADRWLRDQALAAGAPSECPTAEELYSFGAGPGAEQWSAPLAVERRAAIDKHLAVCLPCESFVATLQVAPPSPLVLDEGIDEPEADEAHGRTPALERTPAAAPRPTGRILRPARWLVAAAAASIVVFFGVRLAQRETTAAEGQTSWVETMRGGVATGEAFASLSPRGKVLAVDDATHASDPELSRWSFEASVREGAKAYEFRVGSVEGVGLKAKTTELQPKVAPAEPLVDAQRAWFAKPCVLEWTWQPLSGVVSGAPVTSTVAVVEDAALVRELLQLASREERAKLLHKRGFHAQAVAQLRALLPQASAKERARLEGMIKELLGR
jgi:hypothetical protein